MNPKGPTKPGQVFLSPLTDVFWPNRPSGEIGPAGKLFVVEPRQHVSEEQLEQTIAVAERIGFKEEDKFTRFFCRAVLLVKPRE